jgi:hypothetical protein
MGIFICNIPTVSHEINIENAPLCKCGAKFIFYKHIHKRKKTNEGVVAKCSQCEEEFYSFNEKSVVEKINYFYSEKK